MKIVFKLGMALLFAVIAALVVFLTGLFGDARISTACLRSLVGFICAGVFTYLVTFILEAKGWAAFDKMPDERMADMQNVLYNADDIDFDADAPGDHTAEEFAAPAAFQPRAEEELVHMRTPEAEADAAAAGGEAPAPA